MGWGAKHSKCCKVGRGQKKVENHWSKAICLYIERFLLEFPKAQKCNVRIPSPPGKLEHQSIVDCWPYPLRWLVFQN